MAAGNGFASASPIMVTLTPGGATVQDIPVVARPVGNIRGTVVTPAGTFGGIGVPVVLSSRDITLTTTTRADPALQGTGRVPGADVSAIFDFDSLPAGEYTLTLPASAIQGAAASVPVTVTAGQTVTPTLTVAFPAWNEGTPDAAKSDPLTGTALDARWTAADIGAPSEPGTVQPGSSGLSVTADGVGWDVRRDDDAFHYVHQQIPAGDWVAYVTVTAVPVEGFSTSGGEFISPGGQAGLMVSSKVDPRAANFVVSVTNPDNGEGIVAQGRLADGTTTFPYGQTAAGTNEIDGGTQPALPIVLKIRKVGANFVGFYSTDGGATQHFIGHLAPQFAPGAPVLLGLATTTNEDGTLGTATYRDFVFAPLAPPANPPAAGQ
jgi:hypothetical protein